MFDVRNILTPGLFATVKKTVEVDDTVGNKSVHLNQLLSTSSCVQSIIEACMKTVDHLLPEGYISIGKSIEVVHEATAMLGVSLEFKATLTEIEGNRLLFQISANDALGIILTATHERVVVNHMALMDRAIERAEKLKKIRELL
ncbi:thioesterase family protein [Aminobacterium mobile]|uniref:thioesterase family protein n=1 Tax=Aminobacterium mobile TaxID=81467 RepID=UPI003314581D